MLENDIKIDVVCYGIKLGEDAFGNDIYLVDAEYDDINDELIITDTSKNIVDSDLAVYLTDGEAEDVLRKIKYNPYNEEPKMVKISVFASAEEVY